MGEGKKSAHVLVLPYPSQGHMNPMLEFAKRLAYKGIKVTVGITKFIYKTMPPKSETVSFDTFSDGFDEGGFGHAESVHAYLKRLEEFGAETLVELIKKHEKLGNPIDCIVYDAFLMWALDVAKQFELVGAPFFTQSCAVSYIYYLVHEGLLTLPVSPVPVLIPGLPPMELPDMPSFIGVPGSYAAYFELVVNQFSNIDKADFVLINSFYKLENEVVDAMSKRKKLVTIGPTIPSSYVDKRLGNDTDYGANLFDLDPSFSTNWLSSKPTGSVVYVSFGSMASLDDKQMAELAWALIDSNYYFIWVVRSSEEAKLPKGYLEEVSENGKGLIVKWSPQLTILSNEAVGCFLTHCGWNSTIEALSLGVPLVVMPQWTDQTTNAKYMQDVWKVGIRVKVDENGLVGRKEIENCIYEVIKGEKGKEMRKNALKWKELAKEALSEGGSSDKNIEELVSEIKNKI